jgi:hypothetical protein
MARFFFHFFDGENYSYDEVGLEVASAEDAYLEAVAAAREMWPELLDGRQNPLSCAFEITGEGGPTLFRVEFAELLQRAQQHPAPAPFDTAIVRALTETHLRASQAKDELRSSFGTTICWRAFRKAVSPPLSAFRMSPV